MRLHVYVEMVFGRDALAAHLTLELLPLVQLEVVLEAVLLEELELADGTLLADLEFGVARHFGDDGVLE